MKLKDGEEMKRKEKEGEGKRGDAIESEGVRD